MPIYSLIEELKSENQASTHIQALCTKYSDSTSQGDGFMVKDGILFFKDKYFVSEDSELIPKILW